MISFALLQRVQARRELRVLRLEAADADEVQVLPHLAELLKSKT